MSFSWQKYLPVVVMAMVLAIAVPAASSGAGRSLLRSMHLMQPVSRFTSIEFVDHTAIPTWAPTGKVVQLRVKVGNHEGGSVRYVVTRQSLDAAGKAGTPVQVGVLNIPDGSASELIVPARMPARPGRSAVEIHLQGRTEMVRAWFTVRAVDGK